MYERSSFRGRIATGAVVSVPILPPLLPHFAKVVHISIRRARGPCWGREEGGRGSAGEAVINNHSAGGASLGKCPQRLVRWLRASTTTTTTNTTNTTTITTGTTTTTTITTIIINTNTASTTFITIFARICIFTTTTTTTTTTTLWKFIMPFFFSPSLWCFSCFSHSPTQCLDFFSQLETMINPSSTLRDNFSFVFISLGYEKDESP
ncbi:hypothetical protein E2C01_024386 [Portunus trituberculatus]|uniref:Uncharacterized protein n=1 Tax=Portunus trituberculatus TaxID=210409 RepID=A0A5B7ECN4_PORTR|nr:hypothetical protein [Portunus trituberculatus]